LHEIYTYITEMILLQRALYTLTVIGSDVGGGFLWPTLYY